MDPIQECQCTINRRVFLSKLSVGVGTVALGSLLNPGLLYGISRGSSQSSGILGAPHFAPKVKRVIYLFQSGGPSQVELFDYKPLLLENHGEELPSSVRGNQRLTGMTVNQSSFPMVSSRMFKFRQHGESGAWISDLLPHIGGIADDICIIKSMHTEAINHDPAITFFQTGSQLAGRPSIGSWLSYGLGSDNRNLPAFCVLLSRGKGRPQPIYSRLWGSAFLPSLHEGVQFRSAKDPVLYLNNPPGVSDLNRRQMLDKLAHLNKTRLDEFGDPEINSKISQYEMAYRMQTSVPETMDLSDEPDEIFEMYGPDSRKPGTYAANCLLARRLAEKDVRFIQLYHMGWDQHGNLPRDIQFQSWDTDQATAALVKDLKRRGLLEDTLVIWGGEFGRTTYSQGKLTEDNYGRDHHPRCFTMWMAGGGIKQGITYGETDDFSYNITRDPVNVYDFQATLLHLLGIDHQKLTFKNQGRHFRLTDVHGHVVKDILA